MFLVSRISCNSLPEAVVIDAAKSASVAGSFRFIRPIKSPSSSLNSGFNCTSSLIKFIMETEKAFNSYSVFCPPVSCKYSTFALSTGSSASISFISNRSITCTIMCIGSLPCFEACTILPTAPICAKFFGLVTPSAGLFLSCSKL